MVKKPHITTLSTLGNTNTTSLNACVCVSSEMHEETGVARLRRATTTRKDECEDLLDEVTGVPGSDSDMTKATRRGNCYSWNPARRKWHEANAPEGKAWPQRPLSLSLSLPPRRAPTAEHSHSTPWLPLVPTSWHGAGKVEEGLWPLWKAPLFLCLSTFPLFLWPLKRPSARYKTASIWYQGYSAWLGRGKAFKRLTGTIPDYRTQHIVLFLNVSPPRLACLKSPTWKLLGYNELFLTWVIWNFWILNGIIK